MKFYLKFIFIVLFSSNIVGQEPHHINYTIENGLPSNEVYCVYQDTTGYMWFGTDNGVSRYDGYRFVNFESKDGLERMEINKIMPDRKGNVWFSSYFGKVFKIDGNCFAPYRWNTVLDRYKKQANLVDLQYIDDDGKFYFSIQYIGILIIDSYGKDELITPECGNCIMIYKGEGSNFIIEQINNKNQKKYLEEENIALKKGTKDVYYFNHSSSSWSKFIIKFEKFAGPPKCLLWNDSLGILSIYKNIYSVKSNKINKIAELPSPVNYYAKINNDFYIGFSTSKGLYIYRDWMLTNKSNAEQWLNGKDVSYVINDKNNGLWVTTINNGIYYIPNANVMVYKDEFGIENNKFTAVLPFSSGEAFGTSFEGNFLKFNQKRFESSIKLHDLHAIPDICFYKNQIYLRKHLVSLDGTVHRKIKWASIYQRKVKNESLYGADRNFLLKSNKNSFDVIIDQRQNSEFIWDIFRPNGDSLWLATNAGIKVLDGKQLLPVIPELKNIKTISIDQLSSGIIVVGTKGKGIYLMKDNQKIVKNITTSDGLSTNIIEYLWVDDYDNIWVATHKGLNKIKLANSETPLIRQFHTQHGLPTDEINMVRTFGQDIWLATGKGIVIFNEPQLDTITFKPEITSAYINGMDYRGGFEKHFNYDEKNIRIDFHNFDMANGNQTNYRYRLKKNEVWNIQQTNSLSFLNLAPGRFDLEVQAQNKDLLWSKSLEIPIVINKQWWLTYYFLLFMVSVIGLAGYKVFKNRIKQLKKEQQLVNNMFELEKKALLAQMNPHFIFNAFSAIQYYINTNETRKADDYLTDLSTLIRRILDNSRKKEIYLSEEIDLLSLYTQLEEKRFDQKFVVIFEIDEEIETESIKIPGMLLQPIVENAINHGLMHLKDKEGRLKISFNLLDDQTLRCIIEDNGIGMKHSQNIYTDKKHQSFGTTLLKERIASYTNSGEYHIKIQYFDLQQETGEAGTRVIVDIQ